jgi:4-diphosphocytidyl-2-C-methyl-D-erythritol kinase
MTASTTITHITLEAPAKINLSLRILRRREDGFHEIATRMAPLQLADRITLEMLPGAAPGTVAFRCDDATVPRDEENLAVQAVRALEKSTGLLPGVRIHLEKKIPHGAGLGGGSSDAAAVLSGLDRLFSPSVPAATMAAAAAAVGSDVPFFLHGGVCDCTGRCKTGHTGAVRL